MHEWKCLRCACGSEISFVTFLYYLFACLSASRKNWVAKEENKCVISPKPTLPSIGQSLMSTDVEESIEWLKYSVEDK